LTRVHIFRMTTFLQMAGLFNRRTNLNKIPRTRNTRTAQITLTFATGISEGIP